MVMQFYVVKDLAIMKEWPTGGLCGFEGDKDTYLSFNLPFPGMVKTVDRTKTGRDFAGKVRDVLKRDYPWAAYGFHFVIQDCPKLLVGLLGYQISDSDRDTLHLMFGKDNYKISFSLSLCHVATENTPVSPDALITLNKNLKFDDDPRGQAWHEFVSSSQQEVGALKYLWDFESGFIYAKLTVVVTVSDNGVKILTDKASPNLGEIAERNRKMLEQNWFTDLEIRCREGRIVKCHRAMLVCSSKVFERMFQGGWWKEGQMRRLEMGQMSEASVKGLLGWVYWNDEKGALMDSDVAVELLIAGDKYDLGGLVERMKEIILERRGYDVEWFSVDSALNLYAWARNLGAMRDLKDKAVGVIKFFGEMFPEKLVVSEEYQELIQNDAYAAINFKI